MPATCFTCGTSGHVAAVCPNTEVLDTRPSWCGMCDPRSRLIGANSALTLLQRCPNCHPSPRKPLTQHKRCPACKMTVYSWDTSPCGMHASPVVYVDNRLSIEKIHRIERENA